MDITNIVSISSMEVIYLEHSNRGNLLNMKFQSSSPKLEFKLNVWCDHNHKKRKDSLEARAERAVLHAYVKNQAILEPILLYRASKYKQTK